MSSDAEMWSFIKVDSSAQDQIKLSEQTILYYWYRQIITTLSHPDLYISLELKSHTQCECV